MLNAVGTSSGDSSETTFALPFEFIDADDVTVEVYESGAWVTKTSGTDYSIENRNVIFGSAPGTAADNVRFSRVTPRSEFYSTPGAAADSPAIADELQSAASIGARGLFVAQEIEDSTALVLTFDAINWAVGVTSANVKHGQTNTAAVGVAVPVACTARTAAVVSYHTHESDPGDWTLRIRKNAAGSDNATFTVGMSASALTEESTSGVLSSAVELAAGDRLELLIDGPSTVGVIFQISLGFTAV